MSPTLTSQGLVLATAMAVSAGTAVLFDLLREKYFPPTSQMPPKPPLKSCLSSGSKKTEREAMKKKKKVKFAEDVKDTKGNGELYRKEGRKRSEIQKSCGNEKMPANHAALYTGILKDRVHRTQYSFRRRNCVKNKTNLDPKDSLNIATTRHSGTPTYVIDKQQNFSFVGEGEN